MSRLDGKVALITGIGSGIGQAAARLFCEQGAIAIGVDLDVAAGQTLAKEFHSKNYQFHFYPADLSSKAACVDVVAECCTVAGKIDILYNNVGISAVKPFLDTEAATLERIMAVNFMSMFYLCQETIPVMQRQDSGVIINTASELAIVAQPLYAAYCASKGAVLSFTRSLALEYAKTNIRINAICPGPIDTPMLQKEFAVETDPAKAEEDAIATMPIGRFGRPEEIAQVALFLASDAPALLHGASVVVDGAKTIL